MKDLDLDLLNKISYVRANGNELHMRFFIGMRSAALIPPARWSIWITDCVLQVMLKGKSGTQVRRCCVKSAWVGTHPRAPFQHKVFDKDDSDVQHFSDIFHRCLSVQMRRMS